MSMKPTNKTGWPKNPEIRTVKSIHTSNVGANEDTKTLWVFGAGASRHLNFPLSFDLFSQSVSLCTNKMKSWADEKDTGYQFFRADYKYPTKPVPTADQIAKFKDDARLALEYLHVWEYLKPEKEDYIPIQDLFCLWLKLPGALEAVGLKFTPEELLKTNPEDLIHRVRQLKLSALVREGSAYDLDAAKRKIADVRGAVQDIYFFTLSLLNDRVRERLRSTPNDSLFTRLVRSFILEKNARVITFNYDTQLDEAIFTHFTRSWKYGGVTVSGINGYPVSTGAEADLLLIKPHGSLNYLICGKCKRAHVNWYWSYRYTGANTVASGNRRCTHCVAPEAGRRELMGSLTVAPLYDKKVIKRSFKAMAEGFQWADHVVSVGYSFPSQDEYVYRLMTEAINAREGKPLSILVISHTAKSAAEITRRLEEGLKAQGVRPKKVNLRASDLEGFEQVKCGTENIDVKP